jgi:hypothetical protein
MTRPPDFDELVGTDLESEERARLVRVHELLVAAGPPPEVSPELEAGPDMLVTYRNPRRAGRPRRRPLVLAAAALALLLAFLGGYVAANRSSSADDFAAGRTIRLHATGAAPGALASIRLGKVDAGGNWPMRVVADGLPALRGDAYYEVFLTRHGKPVAPCGSFIIRRGRGIAYLNAPYKLRGAGWIVTIQKTGDRVPGRVVLTT